jgi:hypothetical protein
MRHIFFISLLLTLFFWGCVSTGHVAHGMWNDIELGMYRYKILNILNEEYQANKHGRWRMVSSSYDYETWQWEPFVHSPYDPFYIISVTFYEGKVINKSKSF